ncbi:unnamed protein product [Echinostoma caproni]|uniref:AXIN2 n=1 Tax=Echinostoma caproni TaxID=27848 RepID=A0A183ATC9_9TREM|nr:unnamed protein product [Echinostoma caproni]
MFVEAGNLSDLETDSSQLPKDCPSFRFVGSKQSEVESTRDDLLSEHWYTHSTPGHGSVNTPAHGVLSNRSHGIGKQSQLGTNFRCNRHRMRRNGQSGRESPFYGKRQYVTGSSSDLDEIECDSRHPPRGRPGVPSVEATQRINQLEIELNHLRSQLAELILRQERDALGPRIPEGVSSRAAADGESDGCEFGAKQTGVATTTGPPSQLTCPVPIPPPPPPPPPTIAFPANKTSTDDWRARLIEKKRAKGELFTISANTSMFEYGSIFRLVIYGACRKYADNRPFLFNSVSTSFAKFIFDAAKHEGIPTRTQKYSIIPVSIKACPLAAKGSSSSPTVSKTPSGSMHQVLRELQSGSIKLRSVPRSPGGTPIRAHKSPLSTSLDPCSIISRALKNKLSRMRTALNISSSEDGNSCENSLVDSKSETSHW